MGLEEYEAKLEEARARRDQAISDLKELHTGYVAMLNEQRAQEEVAALDPSQRAALIKALGVESTTKIGDVG